MVAAVFCGSVSCGKNSNYGPQHSMSENEEYFKDIKSKASGNWYEQNNWGDGKDFSSWSFEDGHIRCDINNANDLARCMKWVCTNQKNDGISWRGVHIYMNTDIDLSAHYWNGIGTSSNSFKGKFYGNGHTIRGMFISSNTNPGGLFGKVEGAYIQDINVIGEIEKSTNQYYIGGVVAWVAGDDTTIRNCTFDGMIKIKSGNKEGDVGGIVGSLKCSDKKSATIQACNFYGEIEVEEGRGAEIGGVVGSINCDAQVLYCANYGYFGEIKLVNGDSGDVGGVVGYSSAGKNDVSIKDCANFCSFSFKSDKKTARNVGGIVGYVVHSTVIDRCINYGDITGSTNSKNFGGLVGQLGKNKSNMDNALANCINLGDISAGDSDTRSQTFGLAYGDRVYGCYISYKTDGAYRGKWEKAPDNPGSDTYIKYEDKSTLCSEAFFTESSNHTYDYSGTVGGHTVNGWLSRSSYSTYFKYNWAFNTVAYDFLNSKAEALYGSTKGNLSGKKCAIPNRDAGYDYYEHAKSIGSLTINFKWKKGTNTTLNDCENAFFTAKRTDGTSSSTQLVVRYLKAAPYATNLSKIFTATVDSTNFKYYSADITSLQIGSTTYTSSSDISKYIVVSNNLTFAFNSSNKYHAFNYISGDVEITVVLSANNDDFNIYSKDELGNPLSGNSITVNSETMTPTYTIGTNETEKTAYAYYKDWIRFTATPRMGYYLKEVKDSNGTSIYSGTAKGKIENVYSYTWFRHPIDSVTFTFARVTYSSPVLAVRTGNSTGTISTNKLEVIGSATEWKIGTLVFDSFVSMNPLTIKMRTNGGKITGTFGGTTGTDFQFGYKYKLKEVGYIYNGKYYVLKSGISTNLFDMDSNSNYYNVVTSGPSFKSENTLKIKDGTINMFIMDVLADVSVDDNTLKMTDRQLCFMFERTDLQYKMQFLRGFMDAAGFKLDEYQDNNILKSIVAGNIKDALVGGKIDYQTSSGTSKGTWPSNGDTNTVTDTYHSTNKIKLNTYKGYTLGNAISSDNSNKKIIIFEKGATSVSSTDIGNYYFSIDVPDDSKINIGTIISGYFMYVREKLYKNDSNTREATLASTTNKTYYVYVKYSPLRYTLNFDSNLSVTINLTGADVLNYSSEQFKGASWIDEGGQPKEELPISSGYNVNYFTKVTLTAADAPKGKRYVGMKMGDKVLTHEKTYTFSVDGQISVAVKSLTIDSVYDDILKDGVAPTLSGITYKIRYAENLVWLSEQVASGNDFEGKIFVLENNIDMSSLGGQFNPIGTVGKPFKGVFDGNGYYIANLSIKKPEWSYVGLFGYAENATIRNLILKNCEMEGYTKVGILVAEANNCKIERVTANACSVSANPLTFYDVYGYSTVRITTLNEKPYINYKVSHSAISYNGKSYNYCFEYEYYLAYRVENNKLYLLGWQEKSATMTDYLEQHTQTATGCYFGGLVGVAYNTSFFASSLRDTVMFAEIGLGSNMATLAGYTDSNCKIDQCYAEGSFKQKIDGNKTIYNNKLVCGSAQQTNCFVRYYNDALGDSITRYSEDSDDEEERQAKPDIWQKIREDEGPLLWQLRVFYW